MLVDANIFLEVILDQKKSRLAATFLDKVAKGEIQAFVPDFTIDSVLLIMHNQKASIVKMKLFLEQICNSRGLNVYSVTLQDRLAALDHIEKYDLDYEDALVLQSALSTKCTQIVSFDTDFDNIKEIKRIEP